MKNTLKECYTYCYETRAYTMQMMQYCLEKGGKFADAKQFMKLVEACQLSQVTADYCVAGYEQYYKSSAEASYKLYTEMAAYFATFNEPEFKKYAEQLNKAAYACKAVCEIAGFEKNASEKKGYEKTAA